MIKLQALLTLCIVALLGIDPLRVDSYVVNVPSVRKLRSIFRPASFSKTTPTTRLLSTTEEAIEIELKPPSQSDDDRDVQIVLVCGFESFNREIYTSAAQELGIHLTVFADTEIRSGSKINDGVNPEFEAALKSADAFVGSLIFDYDDVIAVEKLLDNVKGPRFVFESATELMAFNKVGSFTMEPGEDGPAGPPPAVKAVLSKFSSGKEEDKINGTCTRLFRNPVYYYSTLP
jgi:magnesium chelatase subunit H